LKKKITYKNIVSDINYLVVEVTMILGLLHS